ncbi:high-affinity nicotinic acid transporter [Colletotrichum incanum]|nr:high-affinity nicotinic acid transporter [Colletotrichum incanum]
MTQATSDTEAEAVRVSPEVAAETMRKINLWLVGFYSLVYVFRVIDSANYSNAAIINLEAGTGIKEQLGFTPSQWAWTLSIFSYSYLIFEPTNTVLLKLFRPSRWMFILILAWGVSACCSAAATDFSGMMCVRFAIGMAEAGFFPSVLYHYAFWYRPEEMPQRIAFFYSVGQISSALSGLLAYAISYMDQLGGLPGWRWLFILEGLPAIILAFFAFWLPDYPESAKILNEEERLCFKERLATTAPKGEAHWDFGSLKLMAKDPTFYTFSLYWICHGIGGFGVGFALPTIIYQPGFTTTAYSQLMNIVVCYIMLLFVNNPVVRYLCLIVSVACAGCAYPVIWPERIRALEGTVASGIGIGVTNACAQFGTIFGPRYRTSYAVNISVLVVGICSMLISWVLVVKKDRNRAGSLRTGEA